MNQSCDGSYPRPGCWLLRETVLAMHDLQGAPTDVGYHEKTEVKNPPAQHAISHAHT